MTRTKIQFRSKHSNQIEKSSLGRPTLTIKGFLTHSVNTATNIVEHKFDWKNAIIDAVIISGVTFFSTLGGGAVTGLDGASGIKVALVASFAQFFIFLALKRGIVQTKEK